MSGSVEPSANARVFAGFLFDMFVALQAAGFSEHQALVIIGQIIATNTKADNE